MGGLGDILGKPAETREKETEAREKRNLIFEIKEELKDAVGIATLGDVLSKMKNPPSQSPPVQHQESPIKLEAKLNLNEMIEAKEKALLLAQESKDKASQQRYEDLGKYLQREIDELKSVLAAPQKSPTDNMKELIAIMTSFQAFKEELRKEIESKNTTTSMLATPQTSGLDARSLIELEKLKVDTQLKLEEMRQSHENMIEEARSTREVGLQKMKQEWDMQLLEFREKLKQADREERRWVAQFEESRQSKRSAQQSLEQLGAAIMQAIAGEAEETEEASEPLAGIQDSPESNADDQAAGQAERVTESAPAEIKTRTAGFKCRLDTGDFKCDQWIPIPKGSRTVKCPKCDSIYEVEE